MRRACSGWCATSFAALALLAGCAGERDRHVTQAQMTVVRLPHYESEYPKPAADAEWQTVALPIRILPAAGESRTDRYYHWFRIERLPDAADLGMLYVPRTANPGHPQIASVGDESYDDGRHNHGPSWNTPVAILFDAARLPSRRYVDFGVHRNGGRQLIVSTMWLGDGAAPLVWRYRARMALHDGLPRTIGATLLVFAAFAAGFWWRRREAVYLFAACAMLAWCVRLVHYHVRPPPDPWGDWFLWASVNSMLWVMLFTYLFALRVQDLRAVWLERTLVGLTLATGIASLPLGSFDEWRTSSLVYAGAVIVALAATVAITRLFFVRKKLEWGLLAGSLWISLGFGVHDVGLRAGWVPPESVYLLPLSAVLIFGAFAYAILNRYSSAIDALERSNRVLDARVNEARRELQASYAQLARIEAERATIAERERLVREMHDSIGSALASSLLLVEQGRLGEAAIADVLRQCIEDLRITIDSTDTTAGDLVTVLANLRFRLGNRLAAAGIAMLWDVEDVPQLPWLSAEAALQILRIVQEALTNVIKHAQARTVRCEIAREDDTVVVRIVDDGHGFDPDQHSPGRGLVNQRKRAAELGADIAISSGPQGTRLELRLPLSREREHRHPAAPSSMAGS